MNVTVNSNIYFNVTAEDGITSILYSLLPQTTEGTAFVTSDGKPLMPDGSNAVPVYLKNSQSTILPSIGLIIEF